MSVQHCSTFLDDTKIVLLSSFLVVQMCTTVLVCHVLRNTWGYRNKSLLLPNSLEQIRRRNKALIGELSEPRPGSNDLHFTTQFSQPFFVQCRACLWKQRCSYWRNQPYTAVRFSFTTITALMLGSMFWDLGGKRDTLQNLNDAMGCLYTSVLFLGIVYASSVQPVVDIERTVFYRERAAGMYSALPYAFAQVVVEIPYIFSQAVVFGLIVYAMIGFDWTVVKFFWFMFIMFCCLLYMTYFGMMSVAVTPNTEIASVVAAAFYGLWNLFSGYIIPEPKIPVWWRWYYWADPMAWTQYGLVVSQLGDFDSLLNNGETVKEYLRHYYGFKHDFIGVVAGVHVGFVVIFAVIFSFCIKSFNFQKR